MKILFSGVSSWTGFEFAKALLEDGNEVVGFLTGSIADYDQDRLRRLSELTNDFDKFQLHENVSIATSTFCELISSTSPDIYLFHAHPMSGFRSHDYDAFNAARSMTLNLSDQIEALSESGCKRIIYSGSAYAPKGLPHKGHHPAVSAYGLSKSFVYELVRLHAAQNGIKTDLFVIPNPIGVGEKGKFTNYLTNKWINSEIPIVNTPEYVRDNIPLPLLSTALIDLVGKKCVVEQSSMPSGYVETQFDFGRRVALEFGRRLGAELRIEKIKQREFSEPLKVFNTDTCEFSTSDEGKFWDSYFEYHFKTVPI